MEERIQKIIAARAGISRRRAETCISEGRVRVNGNTAQLGDRADPDEDVIELDSVRLPKPPQHVYLMLHKPRGFVTTMSDEQGRRTVCELVADCGARVVPVGRLDLNSEGLLLLTDDGAWMQRILHPKHEVDKIYRVSVVGDVRDAAEKLAALTAIDGEPIRPAQVKLLRKGRETAELSITIHEGKNRQIRRMCASVGLHVKRLKRVAEHTLTLGDLPLGKWRYLTAQEVAIFNGG